MILDKIVAHKRTEIEKCQAAVSFQELRDRCEKQYNSDFGSPGKFSSRLRTREVALIAEIKKASPSKGLIRADFDPVTIAGIYTQAGASAISVLTDREFFQGSPDYLQMARSVTTLPLLRKDFIIDSYQVYEAKLLGADAILLIMAILSDKEAADFYELATGLGMDCLIEVHTEEELDRAMALGAEIIGINNRNLHTFKTELSTTFRLREKVTDANIAIVSESGINTRQDVERLQEHGVNAMLVGEALMREQDITGKISELLGKASGVTTENRELSL